MSRKDPRLPQGPPVPIKRGSRISVLSPRQVSIIKGVGAGYGDKDIAYQLGLAETSVRTYLSHIFDKVGVRTRVELVLWALENLVTPEEEYRKLLGLAERITLTTEQSSEVIAKLMSRTCVAQQGQIP